MVNNSIILFDGVCNLCSSSVQFVIKRDPHRIFRFCQLQSQTGKALLRQYGIIESDLTSVILIQDCKAYQKSSAALQISRRLNKAWPLLTLFLFVPPFIRDRIYDFIGNRRYAWFGKKQSCWIPDANICDRFLDDEKPVNIES